MTIHAKYLVVHKDLGSGFILNVPYAPNDPAFEDTEQVEATLNNNLPMIKYTHVLSVRLDLNGRYPKKYMAISFYQTNSEVIPRALGGFDTKDEFVEYMTTRRTKAYHIFLVEVSPNELTLKSQTGV